MSPSGINPRTTAALQEAGFHLVGCSAYMAIILKSLSCCLKHTPQYIVLVGPIIIWLFISSLCQTYNRFQEVIENWKSDGSWESWERDSSRVMIKLPENQRERIIVVEIRLRSRRPSERTLQVLSLERTKGILMAI
ncbi:hypothetical protein H4I96_01974 [Botrytis cinerea]